MIYLSSGTDWHASLWTPQAKDASFESVGASCKKAEATRLFHPRGGSHCRHVWSSSSPGSHRSRGWCAPCTAFEVSRSKYLCSACNRFQLAMPAEFKIFYFVCHVRIHFLPCNDMGLETLLKWLRKIFLWFSFLFSFTIFYPHSPKKFCTENVL